MARLLVNSLPLCGLNLLHITLNRTLLRGYSELEAVPLSAPEVLTPIGFMYSFNDRPSHALRAALNMASDSMWRQHVVSYAGLLKSEVPGGGIASRRQHFV